MAGAGRKLDDSKRYLLDVSDMTPILSRKWSLHPARFTNGYRVTPSRDAALAG